MSPLRSLPGHTRWAELVPLSYTRPHLYARQARAKPLTLIPGFKKGRHCKAHVESVAIDYSATGPFRSGKGPRELGFYQRAEHLRHDYRKPPQPPIRKKTTSASSSSKVSVHFDPHTVHFEHEASPSQLPSVKALDMRMFTPRIAENSFCPRLEQPMPSATDFMSWEKVLARVKRVLASKRCSRKTLLAVDGRLHPGVPVTAIASGPRLERRIARDLSKLEAESDLLLAWSRSPFLRKLDLDPVNGKMNSRSSAGGFKPNIHTSGVTHCNGTTSQKPSGSHGPESSSSRRQSIPQCHFENTCLIDALRAHRLKVPYTCEGPFYALRDGCRFLRPLGLALQRSSPQDIMSEGKFIVGYNHHFVAVRRLNGCVEVNFKHKSHTWENCCLSAEHPLASYYDDKQKSWMLNLDYVEAIFRIRKAFPPRRVSRYTPVQDYRAGARRVATQSLASHEANYMHHTQTLCLDTPSGEFSLYSRHLTVAECTQHLRVFCYGERQTRRLCIRPGDVPREVVARRFADMRNDFDVLPVMSFRGYRSMLLMVVPRLIGHSAFAKYVLVTVGDQNMEQGFIVPFVHFLSWDGLWNYLSTARGLTRPSRIRCQVEIGDLTLLDTDDLSPIPGGSMLRLCTMPCEDMELDIDAWHTSRLPWPRTGEEFLRWHLHSNCVHRMSFARTLRRCYICSCPLSDFPTHRYSEFASKGSLKNWSSTRCALVSHMVRPCQDDMSRLHLLPLPACVHPALIQLKIGAMFACEYGWQRFELLPGTTIASSPLWQPASSSNNGFHEIQGLAGDPCYPANLVIAQDYEGAGTTQSLRLHTQSTWGDVTSLASPIREYIVHARLRWLRNIICRNVYEFVTFPDLWHELPNPYDFRVDTRTWEFRAESVIYRAEKITFLVPDSVMAAHPRGDRSLTDVERALKRLDAWHRIMLQMCPHGDAVDMHIMLSPVNTNISKRVWERELCDIRRSLRILEEAPISEESDYPGIDWDFLGGAARQEESDVDMESAFSGWLL